MCKGSPNIRLPPTFTEETLSTPHELRHEARSIRRAGERLDIRTKFTVRGQHVLYEARGGNGDLLAAELREVVAKNLEDCDVIALV